ncbi:MAG TPA: class I SAM-dependent methyltransferase [Ktedonobacterales bacterium]
MPDSIVPSASFTLDEFYDLYPRVEEEFQAALDVSLNPRGPDQLYDLVESLVLPPGSSVLDLGCGEGRHSLRLASRFGFTVHGVDPVPRHIELAGEALAEAAAQQPELSERVRFELGAAETIPAADATYDLVWCRDVLVHVADLDQAYTSCRRVLRPGGRMLVYQMFGAERMEPREAAWLYATMGCVPQNMDPSHTVAAIAHAELHIEQCLELGSEWGERYEEDDGHGTRQLLHAARLFRAPERYRDRFGPMAYDMMLGDCLWHIYRMIGKLSPRIYLLAPAT